MKKNTSRRDFIRTTLLTGAGLGLANSLTSLYGDSNAPAGKRVGLIGLDTSHVTAVTNALNNPKEGVDWDGYKVVAAYPTAGSSDLPASINRLAGFTEALRKLGVG